MFAIIMPKRRPAKSPKKDGSRRRVFRMFKRLNDGSFLIAGFVDRYPKRRGGY